MPPEHKNSPSDKIRRARNVVKSTIIFGSIIFVVGKSPMDIMEPILL